MKMRSLLLSRSVLAIAGVAALTTAIIAVLGMREPITVAAVTMNPDTGELVASAVGAGFRYPPVGVVAVLALLMGGVAALVAIAWMRRSELLAAARRLIHPERPDAAVFDADATDILENAVVESLD
jgi:hypothetical protein